MLPSAFRASVLSLSKTENVQRSVSQGGNIQIGRRTKFETRVVITSPIVSNSKIGDLIAFIDDIGMNNPFDISLPVISKSGGSITANLQVKIAAAAGRKVIILKGGPSQLSDIVKPNDMLNFAGHSKAYFVGVNITGTSIDSFDTNEDGELELRLSSPLIKDVAVDEIVNFVSPIMTVIRVNDDNDYSISVSDKLSSTVSFEAVEFI